MASLKDQLKRERPAPKARPIPTPIEVNVDNKSAAELVVAMQQQMAQQMALGVETLKQVGALVGQLTQLVERHETALNTLLKREPKAPVFHGPDRPTSFYIELDRDENGETTGMHVEAYQSE